MKFYQDLNVVITSSLDSCIHFLHSDSLLPEGQQPKKYNQKGVTRFVYSKVQQCIASCGEDRYIVLWDPLSMRLITKLYGHYTGIKDLALSDRVGHLVSLGTDNMLKVWDVKTFQCIQTLMNLPTVPSGVFIDPYVNVKNSNIILFSKAMELY